MSSEMSLEFEKLLTVNPFPSFEEIIAATGPNGGSARYSAEDLKDERFPDWARQLEGDAERHGFSISNSSSDTLHMSMGFFFLYVEPKRRTDLDTVA